MRTVKVVPRRTLRYINVALSESFNSTYNRVRIGAVIVDGNYLVSKAANLSSSHPMQYRFNNRVKRVAPAHNMHAEMHALVRSKSYDLTGCEVFVARFDRRGRLAMCKPCKACHEALLKSGVKSVTYTTPQGIKHEDF